MKNKNIMSSLTGGTKIFLLICLAVTFVTDFAVTVVLGVQGIPGSYFTFPLLLMLADAAFLAVAVFSNFRFAYTIKHLVIYIVISVLILLFTVIFNICGREVVYSNFAAALWLTVHSLSILGAIYCYLYTAKRIRSGRGVQTAIIILFTVIYAGLIVFYVITLFGPGHFGQSVTQRQLIYVYDEDSDSYVVEDVLDGKADSVYVPAEFNGKRIGKISSNVFTAFGLERIFLDCSPNVEFTDFFDYYPYGGSVPIIYTSKENTDKFKRKFYNEYEKYDISELALDLANATIPGDLASGEVYVTFSYDKESYEIAKHALLSTWIGERGDTFNLSYASDIGYARYSNRRDDGHLLWNYNNNGKYILSEMKHKGYKVNGETVSESITALPVKFERVYQIYPGASNDLLHETTVDFKPSVVNGERLNYKLTVKEYADEILTDFYRIGFTETFYYELGSRPFERIVCESLAAALDYHVEESYFTLYPEWSFDYPELQLNCNYEDGRLIYGEDLELTALASSEAEGAYFEYSWQFYNGQIVGNSSVYSKRAVSLSDSGDYYLEVTAKSTQSSLYATDFKHIYINVDPRPVEVEWTLPENLVFDGTDKQVYCNLKEGDILSRDEVELSNTVFSFNAAGLNTMSVYLIGYDSYNYVIVNADNSITIEKAPLKVVWGEEELIYNRSPQHPSVELSGLIDGADELNATCNTFVNAGEHKFKVTLSGFDSVNYYLTNPEKQIKIKPYGVTVEWNINAEETIYYSGDSYYVSASATGIDNEHINVVKDIERITDAGTYEIKAALTNTNYFIAENATKTYTIEPYSVSVEWNDGAALYYNGYRQHPSFRIIGRKGVYLDAEVAYASDAEGYAKNAGNGYTCSIARLLPSNGYNVNNYVLSSYAKSCTYSIARCSVSVEWGSLQLVYNGKAQAPEAYIQGVGGDGKLALELNDYSNNINVGKYHIVAEQSVNGAKYPNYVIINNGTDYEIVKRTLVYRANDITVSEGESLESVSSKLTYTPPNGIVSGEDNVIVSDIRLNVEGYTGAAGKYVNFIIITGKVSGDKKDNYEVKFVYGTLTVLPKENGNAV